MIVPKIVNPRQSYGGAYNPLESQRRAVVRDRQWRFDARHASRQAHSGVLAGKLSSIVRGLLFRKPRYL